MRGKKIELTPVHIEKLTRAIQIGATYELAARYAGISKDTFDRWRKAMEAAPAGTPLADLRTRLRRAEAQAALGWLTTINEAAETDWGSAAWLLARRYPEAYGRTFQKAALTSPDGARPWEPVIYLPSKSPSPEQWQHDVRALRYPANGMAPQARP
jgi:hypothetical protein